jgi:hypothetical protein
MDAAMTDSMKYLSSLSLVFAIASCANSDAGAMDPDPATPDVADEAPGAPTDAVETAADSIDAAPAPAATPAPPGPVGARQAALPQPSITLGGSSTAATPSSLAGTSVVIDGGTESAAYALVSYRVSTGTMDATAEFTVNPAPNAAFSYLLTGSGGGYSSRHIKLKREPGSDALQAATTSGYVTCGALPSGQPTTVTLAFDGTAKTFDVLIAGAATPCTNLSTKASGPVAGFRMVDESTAGFGGHVEFSDLVLLY